jgi:hypothetical protein
MHKGRVIRSFNLQFNPIFLKDYPANCVLLGIRLRVEKLLYRF